MQVPYRPVNQVAPSSQPLAYATAAGATPAAFGAQVGQALQGFGAATMDLAQKYQQREEETAKFEALKRYNEFLGSQQEQYTQLTREAPANGVDFALMATKSYDEAAEQFLTTLPEPLQDEYAARLAQTRAQRSNDALNEQFRLQDNFAKVGVDEQINAGKIQLDQDPGKLDQTRAGVDEFIKNAPWPEEIKEAYRKKAYADLEEAAFRASVREDPSNIGALGVGKFPAMNLPKEVEGRAALGMSFFHSQGLEDFKVAGIMGHLLWESGGKLNGNARNPGDGADGSDSIGIAQWNADRAQALKEFAAMNRKPWTDLEVQFAFVMHEMQNSPHGRRAYAELQRATNVEEAVAAFMHYERPAGYKPDNPRGGHGWSNRLANAMSLMGMEIDASSMGDERFANIPYERRMALAEDALAQSNAMRTAQARAAQDQYNAQINQLMLGIHDGTAGLADIQAARGEWLTEYADVKKATDAWEARNKDVITTQQAVSALSDPNYLWDPTDSDNKKMLDSVVKADNGQARIGQRDDDYIDRVVVPMFQQSRMLPPSILGAMQAMARSSNPQDVNWAYSQMDRLEQMNPRAFGRDAGEEQLTQLMDWRRLRTMYPEEEIVDRMRESQDPRKIQARKALEPEAREALADIAMPELLGHFDDAWLDEPEAPLDPMASAAMRAEFDDYFVDQFTRTYDKEVAKTNALKLMERNGWGVSRIGGEPRMMKFAPEKVYGQEIDGSFGWMREQAVEELTPVFETAGLPADTPFELIASPQTEDEIRRGLKPSYLVVARNEFGAYEVVQPEPGKAYAIAFDPTEALIRQQEKLRTEATESQEDKARLKTQREKYGLRAIGRGARELGGDFLDLITTPIQAPTDIPPEVAKKRLERAERAKELNKLFDQKPTVPPAAEPIEPPPDDPTWEERATQAVRSGQTPTQPNVMDVLRNYFGSK